MKDKPAVTDQAQLLAGVLDSSLDGILAFRSARNGQGEITDFIFEVANRKSLEIVNKQAEDLIGKRLLNVFPGNKIDGLFDAYVRVAETGEPFFTEHHYIHDGLDHWFSIRAAKYGDGFTVTFADINDHKASELALRETASKLAEAKALAKIGSWDWDRASDTITWSDETKRIFGLNLADDPPNFAQHQKQIHPDDLDHWNAVVFKAMEDGLPYILRSRILQPDGTVRVMESRGQCNLNAAGEVDRMFGTVQDITERAEAEDRLKLAVDRYDLMAAGSATGIWDWDCLTNTVYFSTRFQEVLGYGPGEMEQTLDMFVTNLHPDDRDPTMQRVQDHLDGKAPYDDEYRLKHKDGHYVWCHAAGQAQWDSDGQPVRMAGSIADISERVARAQSLQQSKHRLLFALDASRSGLWDWQVETGEAYFSDSWYTMLGYAPGDLPMSIQSWIDITEPGDLQNAKAALDAYFAGETDRYACEMRVKNKAGDWQWIMDVGEAVERDEAGAVTRMVGLHLDIHDQKLAQAELAAARDIAQQASASKSAFVANMSHEIRTPMNAILGYADLMLDIDQTESDKRNHAQTIRRNGKHLMGILNDVLDISKIEAGKMSIERIACAPDQLFADVIMLMMPKAMEKGIDLDMEAVNALPPRIMTDPTRLRQILLNLVGNAIKFTNEGSIRINVRNEPTDTGEIQLTCDVTDTGIGITPEQHDRLFKPFNQADESTTRRFGGTGLGLTISLNLCELLGGALTCTSEPGKGSTFSAQIIVGDAEKEQPVKPKPRAAATINKEALKDRRVLVVEDGIDNQRLIRHYLTKAGAEIDVAENGAIGRDLALQARSEDRPFDVVLMDMQMPVLDGYSATRELREADYTQPIIALTAHASPNDRKLCLEAGCNDYLTKPIDRDKLIRTVVRHLEAEIQQSAGI